MSLLTAAAAIPQVSPALVPRRELLEVRHLSVLTLAATAAVLVSIDREGRTRRGPVAARLAGVAHTRSQVRTHAAYWRHAAVRAESTEGPLWVVLGDSAAQGIGAADPEDGYVGRIRAELTSRAGLPWRVVNLSTAGASTVDVLAEQIPRLRRWPHPPDLVSCGVGANDVLRTAPRRLRAQLDQLAAGLPPSSVLLTLPAGLRGYGRSYVDWLNAGIRASASRYGHRVADVANRFGPPWRGKFSPDGFHPSARGYADWATAILDALDAGPLDAGPSARNTAA
ncbi:MAG TPA: SGNH/GDSL hydrolase family protein [Mycobacteriales bacterium]|nr:SGNH/GDSL hydrolase family protein [Mycobacteriales bacterium]